MSAGLVEQPADDRWARYRMTARGRPPLPPDKSAAILCGDLARALQPWRERVGKALPQRFAQGAFGVGEQAAVEAAGAVGLIHVDADDHQLLPALLGRPCPLDGVN